MSVTKTRSLLVDVARRLFAQQGLEGTTMNDIAVASNRGRRTLYTYFKNKEEIYYAVIETEVERLSDKMDEVVSKDMDPEQKIIAYKEAAEKTGLTIAEVGIWRNALSADPQDHTGRRNGGDPGGRPGDRRDQPEPGTAGGGGQVPGGPLLPP